MSSEKSDFYKHLLQADINNKFVQACRDNSLSTVEYLLTSSEIPINAQINEKDTHGSVGLCAAIASRSTEVAKFLMTSTKLKEPANIHIQEDSPFYFSVINENKELIQLFVFELKIEKTQIIIDYMKDFDDNGYAEKMFSIRELSTELDRDLKDYGKNKKVLKV
jgi:DNA polymerase elongation subunit (family B)